MSLVIILGPKVMEPGDKGYTNIPTAFTIFTSKNFKDCVTVTLLLFLMIGWPVHDLSPSMSETGSNSYLHKLIQGYTTFFTVPKRDVNPLTLLFINEFNLAR